MAFDRMMHLGAYKFDKWHTMNNSTDKSVLLMVSNYLEDENDKTIRKSKDYVYGKWVYKVLSIWKGYYRVKET